MIRSAALVLVIAAAVLTFAGIPHSFLEGVVTITVTLALSVSAVIGYNLVQQRDRQQRMHLYLYR